MSVWRPRTGKLTSLGQPPSGCGPDWQVGFGGVTPSALAYGNGRALWVEGTGGNAFILTLLSATTTAPSNRPLWEAGKCCIPSPCAAPQVGHLVGRGRLLVFSTWTASCNQQLQPTITSQTIWRLAAQGSVVHYVEVAETDGPLAPLDVDGGRIVALRGENTIELLDQAGSTLRAFTPTAAPLAAVLSGRALAVLVQGALEVYDTETGVLTHTWPLPNVPSGGRCTNLGDGFRCPQVRLQLIAANAGLALYLLDGKAHLLSLRDGRDVTVDRAVAADLTSEGLFYTFRTSGPYHSRVRFVPSAKLPLKP